MERLSIIAVVLTILIGVSILLLSLVWSGLGEPFLDLSVKTSKIAYASLAENLSNNFRFAVSTIWNPEETFLRYRKLGLAIGRVMEKKQALVIRSSYREVRASLETAKVDAALVCTGTLLNLSNSDQVEILAAPQFIEGLEYRGLIVVHKDSPIHNLQDLEGRVVAMTDPESFTGCILPCTALLTHTDDLDGFLQGVVFMGSHDRAVKAIASGWVDAASVTSLVYAELCKEQPEIREKTRVLWESDTFGPPHILVPVSLAAEIKDTLKNALLTLHEDHEGYTLLKDIGIKRFIAPTPGLYDSALALKRKLDEAGGCPWQ